MLQSKVFLGSTKHPATWQNKATDVYQTFFCVTILGNPDTVRILLMFAVSTITLAVHLNFTVLSYYGVEGIWMVSTELSSRN